MKKFKPIKNIFIVGNPDTGKSTIFNALTGLHQKGSNYVDTTVEKKIGYFKLPSTRQSVRVFDLPGAFSLTPHSIDEVVVHDLLLGTKKDEPQPDLVVIVADATKLERNLFFASQVLETGRRAILVLNMWDLVEQTGLSIDVNGLDNRYRVRIVKMCAVERDGIRELKNLIETELASGRTEEESAHFHLPPPPEFESERVRIERIVKPVLTGAPFAARSAAFRLLSDGRFYSPLFRDRGTALSTEVSQARQRLEAQGVDWSSVESAKRYEFIRATYDAVVMRLSAKKKNWFSSLDAMLIHPWFGLLLFMIVVIGLLKFTFDLSFFPSNFFTTVVVFFSDFLNSVVPNGRFKYFLIEGVLRGASIIFVCSPYVFFFFLLSAYLENMGYWARVSALLSRHFRSTPINTKSFVPFINSYTTRVPGIMSARNMTKKNNRLLYVLLAPFPNFGLIFPALLVLSAALMSGNAVFFLLPLPVAVLTLFYFGSLLLGAAYAHMLHRFLLKKTARPYVIDLAPLRLPSIRAVFNMALDPFKRWTLKMAVTIIPISGIVWLIKTLVPEAMHLDLWTRPIGMISGSGLGLLTSFFVPEAVVSSLFITSSLDQIYVIQNTLAIFTFVFLIAQIRTSIQTIKQGTRSFFWPLLLSLYMVGIAWLSAWILSRCL